MIQTPSIRNFGKIASAFLICFTLFFGTKIVFAANGIVSIVSQSKSIVSVTTSSGTLRCSSTSCTIPSQTGVIMIQLSGGASCSVIVGQATALEESGVECYVSGNSVLID